MIILENILQWCVEKYFAMVTECEDGTYGYNCTNNCSGHCLNNSICNKQTGHCDRGCNPGYTNRNCSKGILIYIFMLLVKLDISM